MLAALKDANEQRTCYAIMSYLFTNELGDQYSWLGQKGKKPFDPLRLSNFIMHGKYFLLQMIK